MSKYKIIAKCFDKKRKLLSEATNSYSKTHPIQAYFADKVGRAPCIYLHAEIAAIIKAGDKKIHRIEVYRYDKGGHQKNAEPCPICKEAIKAYGIKFVSWTL